jgi:hypothetical protein
MRVGITGRCECRVNDCGRLNKGALAEGYRRSNTKKNIRLQEEQLGSRADGFDFNHQLATDTQYELRRIKLTDRFTQMLSIHLRVSSDQKAEEH